MSLQHVRLLWQCRLTVAHIIKKFLWLQEKRNVIGSSSSKHAHVGLWDLIIYFRVTNWGRWAQQLAL